jgi:hypothetical protein
MNLVKSLARGNMPNEQGEILISDDFAKNSG